MKKKLLLFLSKSIRSQNVLIASTFAWLSKSRNYLFDNYFDSYHQGVHFPAGDWRNLEIGQLTGGTVSGDQHFGEFYFMLLNFDVYVASFEGTAFLSSIANLNVPVVAASDRITTLYKKTFDHFNVPLPLNIVMVGSNFGNALTGLEAYLYPEIYYRKAVGVPDSISEEELAELYRHGGKIFCLYADEDVTTQLNSRGYDVEVIDNLRTNDDYFAVTRRIASRWRDSSKGWLVGDPVLISHWIPTACEENLIAIYSVPQEKIITEMGDLISSKGSVVYGRQYSDRDFFRLSKLNQCLQVIDPCRPPFQSVKHVEYAWHTDQEEGLYESEYSDEQLRQFARERRILVSLMFWSGMIREVANLHNLMDLFAITRLRCGLVVTAQTYEYMMHSPFELLTMPLEQGGVFPLVEPVLGSCGVGVGIESYLTSERLHENLTKALSRILTKAKSENYVPRGWWATMDADLENLSSREFPSPIKFLRYSPYFHVRFHPKENILGEVPSSCDHGTWSSMRENCLEKIKTWLRRAGLAKYFSPYRPYEFFRPGAIKKDIVNVVKSVGLKYMFTKSGFNSHPAAAFYDNDFIALNYTAGQWDGWTPFETINDMSDLKKAEKVLLRRKKPGWIVSTIDSCLWTFGGEFWKKSNKLYEIAQFCVNGGMSKTLINVKPGSVARYARIIENMKYL